MWIRWLGHAAFLITADEGTRVITDPYQTRSGFNYGRITEVADIVTISHEHADHNYTGDIQGNPVLLRGAGVQEARGIRFRGIASYHDNNTGASRGENTIFCFALEGIDVCHLGDLGHLLDEPTVAEIGPVDVLLIPVGGYFTIDAEAATRVCNQLNPNVIIPMHFKTPKLDLPITKVDPFLEGKSPILRLGISEIEINRESIERFAGIVVLGSAL